MAKYLALWEVDLSRVPTERGERATAWASLMGMVRKHREEGLFVEWGSFVGEESGYAICEGTDTDIMGALQYYVPWVRFKLRPIASEQHVNAMIGDMSA